MHMERTRLPLLSTLAFSLPLTLLIVSCASDPLPLVETRPAPGAAALGSGPPWTRQLTAGNYICEFDNRITVRLNAAQNRIDLTWKGSSYPMSPVTTSTGALRFEDRSSGLVWIQIPSKSMLLNSKIGQQVANECKVA